MVSRIILLGHIQPKTGKSNPFRVGDKHLLEYSLHSIEHTNYSAFPFLYSPPQMFQEYLVPSSMKPQGSIYF